jgi:hypothetical protein
MACFRVFTLPSLLAVSVVDRHNQGENIENFIQSKKHNSATIFASMQVKMDTGGYCYTVKSKVS